MAHAFTKALRVSDENVPKTLKSHEILEFDTKLYPFKECLERMLLDGGAVSCGQNVSESADNHLAAKQESERHEIYEANVRELQVWAFFPSNYFICCTS